MSSPTISPMVNSLSLVCFLDGHSFAMTRYLIASVLWSSFFTGASLLEIHSRFFSHLYHWVSFMVVLHDLNMNILFNFKSSFIRLIPANTSLFHLVNDTPRSEYSSATLQGYGLSGVGSWVLANIDGSATT
jgi:hypothetical protein